MDTMGNIAFFFLVKLTILRVKLLKQAKMYFRNVANVYRCLYGGGQVGSM